jgi:iron-sulfur cluster repair protein YtfE (RIC family)
VALWRRYVSWNGTNYYADSGKSLQDVCAEANLPLSKVLDELSNEAEGEVEDRDWTTAPLADVIRFGTLDGPNGVMEHEHAGEAFVSCGRRRMVTLRPSMRAARIARCSRLRRNSKRIFMHIHLENNILHARVRALAAAQ